MDETPALGFQGFIGEGSLVGDGFAVTEADAAEILEVVQPIAEAPRARPLWTSPDTALAIFAYDGETQKNLYLLERASGKVCGFYEGLCLWVRPDLRGKGLAERLICETARARGGSPVGDEWAVGFSEAGWCAHQRAYELYLREYT